MAANEGAMSEYVDITPEKDEGVLKTILKEGEGSERPSPGDEVFVHYTGTLEDGTKFDSSLDRHEEFSFKLGEGNVIKGWDIGVATMKRGEKAKFAIKSQYGYGDSGSPPKIPGGATLHFEVELLRWKGEDVSPKRDESIVKHQLVKGDGWATPKDGGTVKVHYSGQREGNVFEEKEVEFIMGEGEDVGIIPGLEIVLKSMKKSEKARVCIKSQHAYGTAGNADLGIPPNADLEYVVHLINFEKEKDRWEMSQQEKLEKSEILKTKGNNCYLVGKFERAAKCYKKIVDYLEHETSEKEDEKEKITSLMTTAHLNLAQTYIKQTEYLQAEKECDKVLESSPKNVKGLYRRAVAKHKRAEYDKAEADLKAVLELDSGNKEAKRLLTQVVADRKKSLAQEKNLYKNMLSFIGKPDSKEEKLRAHYKADVMHDVGEWNNDMAKGMMSLDQECEAFEEGLLLGDKPPSPCSKGS